MSLKIAKAILKNNKVREINLPNIVLLYDIVIKREQYWLRFRPIDRRKRIEILQRDSHKYARLILGKGGKTIQTSYNRTLNNLNETLGNSAKEKNPNPKLCILCEFIHVRDYRRPQHISDQQR